MHASELISGPSNLVGRFGVPCRLFWLFLVASPNNYCYDCADDRAEYDRKIAAVSADERGGIIKPWWHPTDSPAKWVLAC